MLMNGINMHTIPAFIAIAACVIILYLTRHRGPNVSTARLYRAVVLMWLLNNLCELTLFIFANNGLAGTLQVGLSYYTVSVLGFALLAHMSLALSTDLEKLPRHRQYVVALYTPGVLIQIPLWFSDWMINGYQSDGGVMPGVAWNSLHGPGYIYLLLIGLAAYVTFTTFILLLGLRSQHKMRRLQCYVVLFSSMPLFILAGIVMMQLLRIISVNQYINTTFAGPFGMIIFCVGTGYAIYRHRLIDIEFYIPWSQARRVKTEFYQQIQTVSELLPRSFDLEEAMRHVSAVLNCPVVVRLKNETLVTPSVSSKLIAEFPIQTLSSYDSMVTVDEILYTDASLAELMRKHKIYAAVPVPQRAGPDTVVIWVLLGEELSGSVYSSRDFAMVGLLFQRMELVFINQLIDVRREMNEMSKSLQTLQTTSNSLVEQVRYLSGAAATAREAARTKDVFLGMISHELRTPLQTIFSSIDLLTGRQQDKYDAKVIHRLEGAACRLETQMKDLTDYARLGAGKLEIRKSAFDISILLSEVVEEHASIAKEKGIALKFDTSSSKYVWSDPDRIRQILGNLLTNALKYTEHGGIHVTHMCLDDGTMKLAVEDTGPGIPSDEVQNMFKPFTQLDSSIVRRHEGVGLGLAIVSGLVEMLGGTIHVDSEVGRGTTIEVSLPYEPATLYTETVPRSGDTTGKSRILVVDDHVEIRESFSEMLDTLGYCCDTSPDADHAISLLSREHYDALLLDIHMPVKNGFDVINELRHQTGPNRSIPVIAISAYAQDITEASVRDVFDEYLMKPVRIEALRATLVRLLATRSTRYA